VIKVAEEKPIAGAAPARLLDHKDFERVRTPAFVYDEDLIKREVGRLRFMTSELNCKALFSLKSFAAVDALRLMAPMLDGFAASSLFEATLAREVIGDRGTVHITTPGFRPDEIDSLAEVCDYISFNSLQQWERFRGGVGDHARCGLRVNPRLSFVEDERYDPCRTHSRLGVPLDALVGAIRKGRGNLRQLSGIHFHTNCESTSLGSLLSTVRHLDFHLSDLLGTVQWLNLGGGYQYDEISSLEPLYRAVELLRRKYGLEVFIEPGEAVVGNAGYIISSILDLFDSEGKTVAVLDTTVNHMPQVYEYQYRPDVSNATESGRYCYILGGATCLAGDLFGEYRFDAPLEIGSKVIFEFMGAYTLVKAHTFNGVNLPSVYALNSENEIVLKRHYTYQDYVSRWRGGT
jgi:carboxynorspermidine decarboxylase